MTKSKQRTARYKHYVSDERVRQVWAAVTKTPCATTRAIGEAIGFSPGGVSAALRILNDAGYIHTPGDVHGARVVLVPFVVCAAAE